MNDYFKYKNKICLVFSYNSPIGKKLVEKLNEANAKVYDINDINLCDKQSIDKSFSNLPDKIDSVFFMQDINRSNLYYDVFTTLFISTKYITDTYLKQRMYSNSSILFLSSLEANNYIYYKKEYMKFINSESWNEMINHLEKQAKKDTIGMMAYTLAKRAINYYTKEISSILNNRGIKVNSISPIPEYTNVEELVNIALFLNSTITPSISGENIKTDNSYTAQVITNKRKDDYMLPAGLKIYNRKSYQNKFKKILDQKATLDDINIITKEEFIKKNTNEDEEII